MNYDTFLFTGHGTDKLNNYDPGATYNGIEEHVIADQIVNEVKKILSTYNLSVHYGDQNFKDNLLKGNTYNFKRGLSVHINSSTSKASGSEILIPFKLTNLDYEKELLNQISTQLKIKNRGLKSRDYNTGEFIARSENKAINKTDYYGEIRNAQNLGIDLSIIEVGFIQTDIPTIQNNLTEIAQIICEYYLAFTHATIKPTDGKQIYYRVVVGSFANRGNAENLQKELISKGYQSTFITTYEK